MNAAPKFSFMTCSWKAPASLEKTLSSIARQPTAYSFETILVNNGFSDERAAYLLAQYPSIHLRIIREPTLGVSYARCTGFGEAKGQIIVLLDDDNSIRDDFLPNLAALVEQYTDAGGICPVILPSWDVTPPEWVQELGIVCLSYTAKSLDLASKVARYWPPGSAADAARPPGGGMIIRREVFEHYMATSNDAERRRLDRTGDSLMGGQDYDIFHQVQAIGLGGLESPALVVYHHIPTTRCQPLYLRKLNYCVCYYYYYWNHRFGERAPLQLGREFAKFAVFLAKAPFDLIMGKHPDYVRCLLARRTGTLAAKFSLLGLGSKPRA